MKNENNYPATVLEIHKEFNTAADKLLDEARETLEKATQINRSKMSRLEKLGFGSSKEVVEGKNIHWLEQTAKENTERVMYYSHRYPNNKFIIESQVEAICRKYNLVCGDVGQFLGFVPEKNLKEIESFSVRKEDQLHQRGRDRFDGFLTRVVMPMSWDGRSSWEAELERERQKRNEEKGEPVGLKICAPEQDMQMRGYALVDGYRVEKVHVPDPVVLQPVNGGYLIVTAWGDEASDENVVNEKFN